jgi:membrane protein insertase Oxa1/YidC/SpoIIIJ
LWITDLAKPDALLGALAAALTALAMSMAPDVPQATRIVLAMLPAIAVLIFAAHAAAALTLYWSASNLVSVAQTAILRADARRSPSRNRGST